MDVLDRRADHVRYVAGHFALVSLEADFAVSVVHACLSAQTHMEPEFKILLSSLRLMAEEWQLAGTSKYLTFRRPKRV